MMIFQCLEHKWLKEVVDKLSGTVIRWSLENHHSRIIPENKIKDIIFHQFHH